MSRRCPKCNAFPFDQFLPGQFCRSNFWPWHWGRPSLTVICRDCKEIVGYEHQIGDWAAWAFADLPTEDVA